MTLTQRLRATFQPRPPADPLGNEHARAIAIRDYWARMGYPDVGVRVESAILANGRYSCIVRSSLVNGLPA